MALGGKELTKKMEYLAIEMPVIVAFVALCSLETSLLHFPGSAKVCLISEMLIFTRSMVVMG